MGERRQLGGLTPNHLGGIESSLIVPVGSTEQHGPHLPLDTDTRIAAAVAAAVALELDRNFLVAPAISYGASGEHQSFAGTISIGTEVLNSVLIEYGRSACDWVRRLVFVNGHGGNLDALRSSVRLLRTEDRDVTWYSCSVAGADAHAGHMETSVLLHLSPEVVLIQELAPGNTEPLADLMPRLRDGGVAAVSESGVLGDPTTATASAGERIFSAMVADCGARVQRWTPGPDGMLT
ncbi:MAG: mycofactocin biosynthesis peptidyl-dipeptidase MftE [Mycobacteriaceae bacterium]